MDLLDVVRPVEHSCVEGEVGSILLRERLEQRHDAVVRVDDLDLHVGSVEVGVAADEVQAPSLPVYPPDHVANAVRSGKTGHGPVRRVEQLLARPQLALDLAPPGESPLGHPNLPPAPFGQRMPLEVDLHVVVQPLVGERVP